MEIVKLKLRLVESEKAYRDRFSIFVESLKRAADDSECFKQTKSKTILKISQEVLKCSEDLLLVLASRKKISQHSEAIYKDFEENHIQAVDILSTYCSNLLDVRSLLLSSLTADCSEMKLPRLLNEALQPVCHVEEILILLQEIKEHLVANRQLVEIFSCNFLIDQLTKGLERIRRTIAGLHAEELVLALREMSIKTDIEPPSLTSDTLAEDSDVGSTEKLPESFTSYTEHITPTASNGNISDLEGQIGPVIHCSNVQPTKETEDESLVFADDTPHLPVQSQNIGYRFEMTDNVIASSLLAEEVDAGKTNKLSETPTSNTVFRSPTESNERKGELEGQYDCFTKETENGSSRSSDKDSQCSSQCQLRKFDIPGPEKQAKRKPPIPSPRTKGTGYCVQSDNFRLECDATENNQLESLLLRRESKKLIRCEVKSISMQISQLRSEISSLEKKIVSLESSESSESSESDDQDTETGTGESAEVFEESGNDVNCSPKDVAVSSGVNLRSASVHYDAGLRDRRTKHLLHSTIWQVPLYQEYHIDVTTETEASASVTTAHEEIPTEAVDANFADDRNRNSRPESGIELEGEGDGDEPVGFYYTPMWNNGSRLIESDYVCMNRKRNSDRCSYGQLKPKTKTYVREWEETEYSSPSRESSTCHYMVMSRTYVNTCVGRACETQDESIYNSVHDIFSAVQIEKELPAQDELNTEEVAVFMPSTSAKLMPGWCNIPAVKESGILENMTKKERHLQEAKYELISSKVSYLKSLSVLQAIFIENVDLKRLMTTTEWNNLFQYIGPIKKCSEHFLADLLSGWPQDMFMSNQLLVVRQYALTGLQTYVNYCSNKVTMDKTLADIRSNNYKVNSALTILENDEICDNNTLESFLVLPIQRITRFPLLVEGILCRMDSNTNKDFCAWAKTYRELVEMAKSCNDAVRKSEEPVEMRPEESCSKAISGRNRISSAFRKKSSTLPKRHQSTVWHDEGRKLHRHK